MWNKIVQRWVVAPAILFLALFSLWVETLPALAAEEPTTNRLAVSSENSNLQGIVEVTGVAQHPGFRKWQLDLLVNGEEKQARFVAVSDSPLAVPSLLTKLDTTRFPNGQHKLRLRVVYTGLNYDEFFTDLAIANSNLPISPTPPPPSADAADPTPADPLGNDPAIIAALGGGQHQLPYAVTSLSPLGEGKPEGKHWIEVDLSDQALTAWQGELPVLQTQVSTGRTEYRTIRGSFTIRKKLQMEHMVGPGYDTPDVPWTMYFKWGFAIHGAYWHNKFGTPVSHGCVNMRLNEAKVLFDWASLGTEVVVHE